MKTEILNITPVLPSADSADDPLLGGSVIRIFVKNIMPVFDDFVQRGTVSKDKFRANTPWNTNEFGFYDLNNNAIFVVEDCLPLKFSLYL